MQHNDFECKELLKYVQKYFSNAFITPENHIQVTDDLKLTHIDSLDARITYWIELRGKPVVDSTNGITITAWYYLTDEVFDSTGNSILLIGWKEEDKYIKDETRWALEVLGKITSIEYI